MSTTVKLRSAVIGYGGAFNMGKHHASKMIESGIEFVAACDLDPARAAQAEQDFPGIRTFTNVSELLAQPDIDLVTVITPHNTHAPLAEQILHSGKHCILEKPMCIHAEDADKLVKLAASKGLMLSVFHNRRWDAWYLTVKDLMDRDLIGDIFHVEMYMGGYNKPGNWWRSSKEISGGMFYDWGAHYIDYLLGIVPGKVQSVRGYIHNRVWHDVTNEDHIESHIQFESGAVAHIEMSSIARAGKAMIRILGTKGAIVAPSLWEGHLTLHTEVNGLNIETKVPCLKDNHDAYYNNIADHLYNGAELVVKPEEARRVIAILETSELSAKAGKELELPYEIN
ncbi:Gfo/Idh/MocA family protein [Paenibacillus spongiae]|uniref:Gfo/Idh/MocA family oxidoreductase n=1 Tax=Paenibacillus spongiae TaxID=2909671 RepID=A0ABY5S5N2_9BACL|nr:Gfo/Idh/MocA family oxidoreductase [Paenibacillus spongiae]UVI27628.1 Gfo/Idh/MocA family oxidoreductase [Paenibacillus spongiae]